MRLLAAVTVTVLALSACGGDAGRPAPGAGGTAAGSDAGAGAGADRPVALDTVAQGAQGPRRSGEVVARTAEEWARAWADHEGPAAVPHAGVDFSRQMLVAVFQGQRRSAGFSVQVQEVRRLGDGAEVRYQRSAPGPDCMTASVITAPFHVVAVERVGGDVRFRAEDRAEGCGR